MKLADARVRLREIALELSDIADALERDAMLPRAPVKSDPITPEKRKEIIKTHLENEDLPQSEIATLCNVNPGRVSVVLRRYYNATKGAQARKVFS